MRQVSMLLPRLVTSFGRADHCIEELCELRDLDRLCIGGKEDVPVVHLHPGGEEVAGRIAEAYGIDDRHSGTRHLGAINSKFSASARGSRRYRNTDPGSAWRSSNPPAVATPSASVIRQADDWLPAEN